MQARGTIAVAGATGRAGRRVADVLAEQGHGAVHPPKVRTQLVAARTVAETLADLATGCGPTPARTNGAPILEIAGPSRENLVEAARLLALHRGEAVRIEAVSNRDYPDDTLYASGALPSVSHAILAGPTFRGWLKDETNGTR